ncbi:hypothetical protein QP028_00560 [Corynebacterium suedekumii]|nr:hypothetical protein QP028_00560 [Corynebacterium suedekumii]
MPGWAADTVGLVALQAPVDDRRVAALGVGEARGGVDASSVWDSCGVGARGRR